ncbi:MAG: NAD(P)H-hydrate dehydratase [bacterium]
MYLVSTSEMKEIEKITMEKFRVPALILMENAGSNVVQAMLNEFGNLVSRKINVFCGQGNNGGDGFVIARHLKSEGANVKIFFAGDEKRFSEETKKMYEMAMAYGVGVIKIASMEDIKLNHRDIISADVNIDALIGTGLHAGVEGFIAELIVYLNTLNKFIVSVDVPSGIDSDTGYIPTVATYANLTVTFGLPKIGMSIYPGIEYVGKLVVADINFPGSLLTQPRQHVLITRELVIPMMPYRPANANKGNFGPVLIIGGSEGLTGAVILAGRAALKSGAGLVTVAAPEGSVATIKARNDEIIAVSLKQTKEGAIAESNFEKIMELSEKAKVVVIGPGAGRNKETQALIRKLVKTLKKPMVIDADGLNAIAEDKDCLKNILSDVILTPHLGEMARLTGHNIEMIIKDKIGIAKKFVKEYNVNVILKDGRSVVVDPDLNVYVNTTGNSGMATPGSGDALTGIIAGFMAHGLVSTQAGVVGNYVHGLAGDLLLETISEEGIIAGDIIDNIPVAIKNIKK